MGIGILRLLRSGLNTSSTDLALWRIAGFISLSIAVGAATAMVVLASQSWVPLAICAGGLVGGMVLIWRSFGLLVSLVVAIFLAGFLQDWTFGSGYSGGIRLPGMMALGLLALSFLSWILHTRGHLRFSLRGWSLLIIGGFVLLNAISVVMGISRYGLLATLTDADWLVWLAFGLLVSSTPRAIKPLIVIAYGTSLVQAMRGVLLLVQGRAAYFLTTGGNRYLTTDDAQLVAAGFLVSVVLLFLVRKKKVPRILIIGAALLQGFGIFISFNRQTWVALGFALAVGWLVLFRSRRWAGAFFSIMAIGLIVAFVFLAAVLKIFPVDLQDVFLRRIGAGTSVVTYLQDSAIQFRFSAWREAWSGIKSSPFLGLGWGAPLVFEHRGVVYDLSPHNTYLWLAYKAGLPALCLYLTFITGLLFKAVSKSRHLWNEGRRNLSAIVTGVILIELLYLVGALWWDYLTAMYVSILIWMNRGGLVFLTSHSADRIGSSLAPAMNCSPHKTSFQEVVLNANRN